MRNTRWAYEVAPARPAHAGKPAAGPVLSSIGAKQGSTDLQDVTTCYELFQRSAMLYPDRPCLGSRGIIIGQAKPFTYMTYREVCSVVENVGSALEAVGVKEGGRVGVLGSNSPEWMIALQVLSSEL